MLLASRNYFLMLAICSRFPSNWMNTTRCTCSFLNLKLTGLPACLFIILSACVFVCVSLTGLYLCLCVFLSWCTQSVWVSVYLWTCPCVDFSVYLCVSFLCPSNLCQLAYLFACLGLCKFMSFCICVYDLHLSVDVFFECTCLSHLSSHCSHLLSYQYYDYILRRLSLAPLPPSFPTDQGDGLVLGNFKHEAGK